MSQQQKRRTSKKGISDRSEKRALILYNDDIHSFDFVIEVLMEVCLHSPEQATQCAYITHYKGKCDIKHGKLEYLQMYEKKILNKGLDVSIE